MQPIILVYYWIPSLILIDIYVETICKKANGVLAFLKRNLYSCNQQIRNQAHMLYIRPILEYASTVWAPYTKSSTEKLEAIQRRATRFVVSDYNHSSSNSNILNQLVWPSLAIRRQVSRLVMFYKIVHQYVALELPNEIVLFNTITRGHNMKYCTPFRTRTVSIKLRLDCGTLYLKISFILIV